MLSKDKLTTEDVAATAFFQGAQGLSLDETMREIVSIHDKEVAVIKEGSTRRLEALAIVYRRLERLQPMIDDAWREMVHAFGHHVPSVTLPFVIIVLAVAALVIDALFLAASLDVFSISDPTLQIVGAFGIASLFTAIFHLAHVTFDHDHNRQTIETKILWRGIAVVAAVGLVSWGIFRGDQMRFAAGLTENPLGIFLGIHPTLSAVVFSIISLIVPLTGAATLHHSVPHVTDWLRYRRAKRRHENLQSELAKVTTGIEAEQAAHVHQVSQLEATNRAWLAVASQYHERGRLLGARQAPHWLVISKSCGWGLGGLALGSLAGAFFPALYIAFPFGTGLSAFFYYRHRRFHPSPAEFQKLESVKFAISSDSQTDSHFGNRQHPTEDMR